MKEKLELQKILNMIYKENKMLKEVYEYYGCSRSTLYSFLKKNGLNFKNNINARINQSILMKTNKNPTKGKKRKEEEMLGIIKFNKEKSKIYWNNKFKNGITFIQYAKICRTCVPEKIKKEARKKGNQIDHIFSIKDCWINKIHPHYVSDIKNLRILSMQENNKKGAKSDCTLQDFIDKIGVKDIKDIQFNWSRI